MTTRHPTVTDPPEDAFAAFLRWHFGTTPDDYERSDTPGYWRRKEACGGLIGGCRQPIHTFIFNEGPMHHTVQYIDPDQRDDRGRFLSPYRTWRASR